jgi:ABC-type branched-subunit amino acid transport system ATPase component
MKVTRYFGDLAASKVWISPRRREISGLTVRKEPAKQTLFNVVTGVHRPDSGVIEYKGKDLVDVRVTRCINFA